jgi:hypothetical protein
LFQGEALLNSAACMSKKEVKDLLSKAGSFLSVIIYEVNTPSVKLGLSNNKLFK